MEQHRVRTVKAFKKDPNQSPYIFVEVEPEHFQEFGQIPTHKELEQWIAKDKKSKSHPIGYAERSFRIGIIKDWKELEPIV